MNYNGINFNAEFWKGKSLAKFMEHEKHHGLTEAQMKEAHSLMNPKKNAPEPQVEPDAASKEAVDPGGAK